MRFQIEVDGVMLIDRTLARFTQRIDDARPAFEEVADLFARELGKQFATEGGHASGQWRALSPKYAAWKARNYPGKKILERSGDLKRSLTRRPFGVEVIREHDMHIGTGVPYARFHQRGAGRLPRRPPLALTEDAKRRMVKIVQQYMVSLENRP